MCRGHRTKRQNYCKIRPPRAKGENSSSEKRDGSARVDESHVSLHRRRLREPPLAHVAHKRFFARMHARMAVPVHFLPEPPVAPWMRAGKGTLVAVHPHVHDELAAHCKLLCTHGAVELFVLLVHRSDVILQVFGADELLPATRINTLVAAERRENRSPRRRAIQQILRGTGRGWRRGTRRGVCDHSLRRLGDRVRAREIVQEDIEKHIDVVEAVKIALKLIQRNRNCFRERLAEHRRKIEELLHGVTQSSHLCLHDTQTQ